MFVQTGSIFQVKTDEDLVVHKELPALNYSIMANIHGYFLQKTNPFIIDKKLYGSIHRRADRILNTFATRSSSTGVLLTGAKGAGKSLLAKQISVEAAKNGIPTLIVSQPHHGTGFNQFLETISQPCIVFFDEFEKVYSPDEQQHLLSLFDGINKNKKLFLLTSNSGFRIDPNMLNRPGRIYYLFEYEKLDIDIVEEYCLEKLEDKSMLPDIRDVYEVLDEFNFDILQSIVEESNRYNESPMECIRFLNIRQNYFNTSYKIKLFEDGKLIELEDDIIVYNPLDHHYNSFSLYEKLERLPDESEEDYDQRCEEQREFYFNKEHLMNMNLRRLEYRKDNITAIVTKMPMRKLAYGYK